MATSLDYVLLLGNLNIPLIYKSNASFYRLQTHGSHTVNGVQLIPGAQGFNPESAYKLWNSLFLPSISVSTPTVSQSEAGISITLNTAGQVTMSGSGSLGNFASGTTLLTEQTVVKQGYLTLTAGGKTSTASSQYVVLGTSVDDTVDFRALTSRAEYIWGGAGNDTIYAGDGDDVVLGGTGNDAILGNEGNDLIYGGDGNDVIQAGQGNDRVYGGNGDDTIHGGTTGDDVLDGGAGNDHITGGAGVDTLTGGDGNDRFYFALSADLFASGQAVDSIDGGADTNTLVLADSTLGVQDSFDIIATSSWARISNVSRIEAEGPYGAQFNLALSDDAYEAGLRVIDLSADTQTNFNANFINVSAETGAANGYTLIGHGGTDFITGGAGNDTITGWAGNDTITGGPGLDQINGGAGSDTYKYAAANESTIINAASVATGFDTVSITSGDVFDFSADVTAVHLNEYYVGQVPQANGDALLTQLNSYYQSAGPSAGIDAMYISIGNNNKGRFLVVDVDNNNQITSDDLIIEIVGITNNKDIQLSLTGGNVVMQEVDPST